MIFIILYINYCNKGFYKYYGIIKMGLVNVLGDSRSFFRKDNVVGFR